MNLCVFGSTDSQFGHFCRNGKDLNPKQKDKEGTSLLVKFGVGKMGFRPLNCFSLAWKW